MSVQDYLEPAVKDFADQAKATYSAQLDPQTFMGKQYIAGEDPLQSQAINMAQQGVGSYQPFLNAALSAQQQSSGTIGGLSSLTGPQAYQQFMSPYQTQVIDETLRQYDQSRVGDRKSIQDSAVASGNFGGGREGAMLGQYDAESLAGRAGIAASLLQSGFQNAQQAASNAFTQGGQLAGLQQNLGTNMLGLSDFQRAGMGQDISALGSMGAMRQGMNQAQLTAQQQADQASAYEPYGRMTQYGNTLTGLLGGVAGQQYQDPQAGSPFQSALSTALGIGGLYGKIFT
jgi:hypothetical protein